MSFLWPLLLRDVERRKPNVPECPLTGNYSCEPGYRYPHCYNPRGLDFNTTQIITTLINCTEDARIFRENGQPNQYGLLSPSACRAIAGDSYTLYPAIDVVDRLTTWKLPLLQLVFLTPRPPLGRVLVSLFVLLRLLGNPGGTIQNYIIKIASCHGRAKFWQAAFCKEGALYNLVGEPRDVDETGNRSPISPTPDVTPPSSQTLATDDTSEPSTDSPKSNHSDADYELIKDRKKFQRQERLWKSLAIIIDSYDEWGRDKGDTVKELLFHELKGLNIQDEAGRLKKEEILEVCLSTAEALAADRRTLLLPVGSAMFLFYVSIGLTMVKTWLAGAHSPGFYLNIEAYSLGFSALYFWIFSAEILAGMIGTSDSEDRIPRILNRFRSQLRCLSTLPIFELHEDDSYQIRTTDTDEREKLDAERKFKGGIYSWQPLMWRKGSKDLMKIRSEVLGKFGNLRSEGSGEFCTLSPYKDTNRNPDTCYPYVKDGIKTWVHKHVLSPGTSRFTWIIVTTGVSCGFAICGLVPPGGFNCRHVWLAMVYGVWLLSWLLDGHGLKEDCGNAKGFALFTWIKNKLSEPNARNNKSEESRIRAQKIEESKDLFLYHLVKDALSTAATFAIVMATQFGILNKCDCYTFANGYPKALHLSQLSPAAEILEFRFKAAYLPLVFCCIAINLALYPGLLVWAYHEGVRVLIQRDDGKSNFVRGQNRRFRHHADDQMDRTVLRRSTSSLEANKQVRELSSWKKEHPKIWGYLVSPAWESLKFLFVLLMELSKALWSIIANFIPHLWLIWLEISSRGYTHVTDDSQDGVPLKTIDGSGG